MSASAGVLPDGTPLYRRELFQMSSAVTSRRNLVLQPPGKKGTVRVIAADDGGQIVSLQLVGKAAVPTVSWVRYAALPSGSTLADAGADGGAAVAAAGGKRSASGMGMVGKMFGGGGGSAAGPGGDAGGGGSGSPAASGGPCRVECLALGLPDVDARPTVSYAVGTTVHTLDKWGRDMGGGFSTNSTEPVRVLSAGARIAEAAGAPWATPSASQAAAGISNLLGAVSGLAAGVMSKAKGAAGAGGGGGVAKSAAAHEAGPSEFPPPAGGSLWVGGDHIVNLFESGSGRDVGYVMCPDRVLSLVAERLVTGAPAHYDCLVGCADRTIRLVSGSAVTAEIAVDGPVAALAVLHVAPAGSLLATAVAAACPGPLSPSSVGHALSGGLTVTTATGGAIYVPPSAGGTATPSAAAAASAPASVSAVPRYVLYGTANGMVGCVQLLHGVFTRLWAFGAAPAVAGAEVAAIAASGSIADAAVAAGGGAAGEGSHSGGSGSSAGVTCVALGDLTNDARPELLVGREDGSLEMYTLPFALAGAGPAASPAAAGAAGGAPGVLRGHRSSEEDAFGSASGGGSFLPPLAAPAQVASSPILAGTAAAVGPLPSLPRLAQTVRFGDSVRCIAVGALADGGRNDAVVQTFTGRLACLSLDAGAEKETGDPAGRSRAVVQREAHAASLTRELEELRKRIAREKERAVKSGAAPLISSSQSTRASAALTATGAPAAPDGSLPILRHEVIANLVLDPGDSAYTLTLEVPALVESVVLQSALPLDLLTDGDAGTGQGGGGSAGGGTGVGGGATGTGGAGGGVGIGASTVGGTAATLGLPGGGASGSTGGAGGGAAASSLAFSTSGLSAALGASVASLFDSLEATAISVSSGGTAGLGIAARLGPPASALADSGVSAAVLLSGGGSSGGDRATPAVVSRTPAAEGTGRPQGAVATLATYRFQEPCGRVVLRFRTIEGQAGDLSALLLATKAPPTSAALVRVPIRPLSQHYRLLEPLTAVETALNAAWAEHCTRFAARAAQAASLLKSLQAAGGVPGGLGGSGGGGGMPELPPAPPASYPLGTLTFTGTFTLSQMHEWLAACLPDVPLRLTAEPGREEVTLAYKNGFLGTLLLASYRKGAAVFRSDSPSALAILRDSVTASATALKVRISSAAELSPYALRHVMHLLHAKLSYLLTLQAKGEVIEAVREMVTTETAAASAAGLPAPDLSFLHPSYRDVLQHADTYARHMRSRGRMLEHVAGIAADAFVDFHRFRGRDVAPRLPELLAMLTGGAATAGAAADGGGAVGGGSSAVSSAVTHTDAYHVQPLEVIRYMEAAS